MKICYLYVCWIARRSFLILKQKLPHFISARDLFLQLFLHPAFSDVPILIIAVTYCTCCTTMPSSYMTVLLLASALRVYETFSSKKHSWDSEFRMWFNNETFPINGCTHRWGGTSVVKLAGEQLDDPTLKSAAPLVVDCSLLFWHNFFFGQCSYIQCHRLNR